ncbi:hypothetical protein EDB81DRAFT_756362 [Dactylonectria macrodidyma]|uniref:Uncharacterized protein n=1 Tax=Dactylonectria macrodidyma TaxID=307937 RepID=A0A9P9JCX4_9HYPO|nr:hypothetical protein EDB81DRAFT_756362 [Dactylonectria macrodidyma]
MSFSIGQGDAIGISALLLGSSPTRGSSHTGGSYPTSGDSSYVLYYGFRLISHVAMVYHIIKTLSKCERPWTCGSQMCSGGSVGAEPELLFVCAVFSYAPISRLSFKVASPTTRSLTHILGPFSPFETITNLVSSDLPATFCLPPLAFRPPPCCHFRPVVRRSPPGSRASSSVTCVAGSLFRVVFVKGHRCGSISGADSLLREGLHPWNYRSDPLTSESHHRPRLSPYSLRGRCFYDFNNLLSVYSMREVGKRMWGSRSNEITCASSHATTGSTVNQQTNKSFTTPQLARLQPRVNQQKQGSADQIQSQAETMVANVT